MSSQVHAIIIYQYDVIATWNYGDIGLLCRRKAKKRKAAGVAEEDPYVKRATHITTQVMEIDFSKEEGEVELHDTLPQGHDTPPQSSEPS